MTTSGAKATTMTVPLAAAARQAAMTLAAAQATPERGLRVYLNHLAVWAVQRYLAWLAIPSDRAASESSQAVPQALFDVADLAIPGVGRLECRPLRAGATVLHLPPEVQGDRLGYVGVQLADSLQSAELLGFLPAERAGDREAIPLSELQPLDNLLARLSAAPQAAVEPIQLQAWLAGVFDAGWQALGDLLAPPRPGLAWRSAAVQRAMVLGCEPPLALCLAVEPEAARVNLHIYLLPLAAEAILPAALRLQVLTGAGEVFRELTAVAGDRGLQYEFFAEVGEGFAIAVQAGDWQTTLAFAA